MVRARGDGGVDRRRHAGRIPAAHAAAALPATSRENVVFIYERVASYTQEDLVKKLAGAKYVVVTDQADESAPNYWADEATAASRIAATGAIPMHYVEYLWRFNNNRTQSASTSQRARSGDSVRRVQLQYPRTATGSPAATTST